MCLCEITKLAKKASNKVFSWLKELPSFECNLYRYTKAQAVADLRRSPDQNLHQLAFALAQKLPPDAIAAPAPQMMQRPGGPGGPGGPGPGGGMWSGGGRPAGPGGMGMNGGAVQVRESS